MASQGGCLPTSRSNEVNTENGEKCGDISVGQFNDLPRSFIIIIILECYERLRRRSTDPSGACDPHLVTYTLPTPSSEYPNLGNKKCW